MKHKSLLIFLHGFGFDKTDNQNFIQKLGNKFNADVVSFDAPFPSGRSRGGLAWYHITEGTREHIFDEKYDESFKFIQKKVKEELEKRELSRSDLILCGRSQGAFMAMQLGLNNPQPCKLVIKIFGMFMNHEKLIINSKPPLIWIEAEKDTIISPQKKGTYKILQDLGIDMKYILDKNSDHNNISDKLLKQL